MTHPVSLVDRLFARFATLYGAQKMATTWASVDRAEVNQVWGEALSRFPMQAIGDAVRALSEAPGDWPPTLPQFVTLCKSYNRPEHRAALPEPDATGDERERAREQLALIRQMLAGALQGKVTSK